MSLLENYNLHRLTYRELHRAYLAAQKGSFVALVQLEDDQYQLVTEKPRGEK